MFDPLEFRPEIDEPDSFLRLFRPTKTFSYMGPWIKVKHGPAPPPVQFEGVQVREIKEILRDCAFRIAVDAGHAARHGLIAREAILDVARATGDVAGRWILPLDHDRVDAAWDAVARATLAGALGQESGVATRRETAGEGERYPLWVGTRDVDDRAEIGRIAGVLKELGVARRSADDPSGVDARYEADVFLKVGKAGKGGRRELVVEGQKVCVDPCLYTLKYDQ